MAIKFNVTKEKEGPKKERGTKPTKQGSRSLQSTRQVPNHSNEIACVTETSMCHQLQIQTGIYQIAAAVLDFLPGSVSRTSLEMCCSLNHGQNVIP